MFGFMKGLKLRIVRSKVKSKKSTIFLFASIVMFRLLALNTLQISCFVFFLRFVLGSHYKRPGHRHGINLLLPLASARLEMHVSSYKFAGLGSIV